MFLKDAISQPDLAFSLVGLAPSEIPAGSANLGSASLGHGRRSPTPVPHHLCSVRCISAT